MTVGDSTCQYVPVHTFTDFAKKNLTFLRALLDWKIFSHVTCIFHKYVDGQNTINEIDVNSNASVISFEGTYDKDKV